MITDADAPTVALRSKRELAIDAVPAFIYTCDPRNPTHRRRQPCRLGYSHDRQKSVPEALLLVNVQFHTFRELDAIDA